MGANFSLPFCRATLWIFLSRFKRRMGDIDSAGKIERGNTRAATKRILASYVDYTRSEYTNVHLRSFFQTLSVAYEKIASIYLCIDFQMA
jgi:hypothetical protein